MKSESGSRIEYLIPTNNIIVHDSYFNITNKSNLIDSLQYDLVRFFDRLVVAYFLGTLYIWSKKTSPIFGFPFVY